jgi:hypothetical protein
MTGKTKDGELRTRIVQLPDGKPSSAPMALTGMPATHKVGNPRTHSSAPRHVGTNESQSPGTPEDSGGLNLSAIQLLFLALIALLHMWVIRQPCPSIGNSVCTVEFGDLTATDGN